MITKDMIIKDVIESYPQTMEVFFDYGISCVGCVNAYIETLEDGARLHNIDIDELIMDLNEYILED